MHSHTYAHIDTNEQCKKHVLGFHKFPFFAWKWKPKFCFRFVCVYVSGGTVRECVCFCLKVIRFFFFSRFLFSGWYILVLCEARLCNDKIFARNILIRLQLILARARMIEWNSDSEPNLKIKYTLKIRAKFSVASGHHYEFHRSLSIQYIYISLCFFFSLGDFCTFYLGQTVCARVCIVRTFYYRRMNEIVAL